jgi:hypothetical protein
MMMMMMMLVMQNGNAATQVCKVRRAQFPGCYNVLSNNYIYLTNAVSLLQKNSDTFSRIRGEDGRRVRNNSRISCRTASVANTL